MGTVGYMSPGRSEGLAADHRSDPVQLRCDSVRDAYGKARVQKATSGGDNDCDFERKTRRLFRRLHQLSLRVAANCASLSGESPEQRFRSASTCFALASQSPAWTVLRERCRQAATQWKRFEASLLLRPSVLGSPSTLHGIPQEIRDCGCRLRFCRPAKDSGHTSRVEAVSPTEVFGSHCHG
jgi:hypothetical protein